MNYPDKIKMTCSHLWRIVLLAFLFGAGLVLSRIIFHMIGISPARMPNQAEEEIAVYYLFSGGLFLSLFLYPFFLNLKGNIVKRGIIIFLFLYLYFGISDSLESAIYSSYKGYYQMMLILIIPILLYSFMNSFLTKPFVNRNSGEINLLGKFGKYKTKDLLLPGIYVLITFPIIYFILGSIVAPFVSVYYESGNIGLEFPGIGTIILIQLVRSLLFLISGIILLDNWNGRRKSYIVLFALSHFALIYSYDIVLAYKLPIELLVIHGIEILMDSFLYSIIFVKYLWKPIKL